MLFSYKEWHVSSNANVMIFAGCAVTADSDEKETDFGIRDIFSIIMTYHLCAVHKDTFFAYLLLDCG